jgi:tetratricopeptide (TPR) repeat protein
MTDGISTRLSGSSKYGGLIVCGCFLLIAAFSRWPYVFYIVLRFLVCSTAIYYGVVIFHKEHRKWAWAFGAVAVLFNPLVPVRMARSDWQVLNLLVAAFFIIWSLMSFFQDDSALRQQHTLETKSESEPEESDTTLSQSAEQWFQAGRNHYDLADIHEIDEEKAIECFEESLRLMPTRTDSHVYLGMIYRDGDGVAQDFAKAYEHFSVAAALGDPNGQRSLGELYESGEGISIDHAKAVYWYRKAAEQQDACAQYRLGVHYFSGLGVQQDREQAFLWYSKASENGDRDAQRALRELATHG